MRATTAIFDVFSFVGAGITSKKIETMPALPQVGTGPSRKIPSAGRSRRPTRLHSLQNERAADEGGARRHVLLPWRRRPDLIGSKWTALIVHDLSEGPRRFTELEHACPGISPRTLSERLHMLEQQGIASRRATPSRRRASSTS